MAYTDIIEFDDNLRYDINVIEWGLYGSSWQVGTSWTNIGNSVTNELYADNEYFDFDSHRNNAFLTIKKRGLYNLTLTSCFIMASGGLTNSQLGWAGIFINDVGFTKEPKFQSVSYTHQDVYQARITARCGGFAILNEGDTVHAAVSRSGLGGSLTCSGVDRMRVAHVFDLAD